MLPGPALPWPPVPLLPFWLAAGSPVSGPSAAPISIASSPSASVTQATRPVPPSTSGSRARTPGVTDRARAGPSLWVSQWIVPRTSTALPRPV